jgi:hypothetical protein
MRMPVGSELPSLSSSIWERISQHDLLLISGALLVARQQTEPLQHVPFHRLAHLEDETLLRHSIV